VQIVIGLAIQALWRFSGDGIVAFNPLLRTIQFPWYTSLSLKTKKPNSPVISVNIGQNTTARVYVSISCYIINEYFNLQMLCIFS